QLSRRGREHRRRHRLRLCRGEPRDAGQHAGRGGGGMSALADPVDALADAFFGALEAGSVEGVLACYAPDARIWHNFDRITLGPSENVAGLETLFGNFLRRRYVEVR